MSDLSVIDTAVFPVAGFGTRFLPATKSMPKELLPLVDTPVIQVAVDEAVSAGIRNLIFITGRNKRAIEDHFDKNTELETKLIEAGKTELLKQVQRTLPDGVSCMFIRQSEQLGLGHAIYCAKPILRNRPFAVLLADEIFSGAAGNVTQQMIKQFSWNQNPIIASMEVNGEELERYGVFALDAEGRVSGLIEKPKPDRAPSNKIVVGRYILTPKIFDFLKHTRPGMGSEIQLTDALNELAKQYAIEKYDISGERYDCGDKQGYVSAFIKFAKLKGYDIG